MSTATLATLQTEIATMKTTYDAKVSQLESALSTSNAETDTFYVLWAACLVFMMQLGFAMLEAGSIRDKNVRNVVLKNMMDMCLGALIWYLFGFGIAGAGNQFIGNEAGNFALGGFTKDDYNDRSIDYTANGYDWVSFFFSYTFAAAGATIVSGSVAERCKLVAYVVYTTLITGFIYPVVVHWVWATSGFMCAWGSNINMPNDMPNIDFAGSGVVHMTGGIAGLIGAICLGPRAGRFINTKTQDASVKVENVDPVATPHSTPLQIIGTFLLWFGWYGFNCGSTLYLHTYARDMARVAVTTTMSAATCGCTGLLIKKWFPKQLGGSGLYEVAHMCNSILGGLVGITAGCATVSVGGSIAIGIISAFVYHGASCLLRKLKIDDPLDAFPVHGACGFWGVLAVGLFAMKDYNGLDGGIFTGDSDGKLLGAQFIALLIEVSWVGGLSAIMFGILKVTKQLRISKEMEEQGLDESKHGGKTYNISR